MDWQLGRRVGAVPATVGLFLAFCLSYALVHVWKNTFDLLFQWLATKEISLPSRLPDIHPFGFLGTISRNILRYLSNLEGATERGLVACLNAAVEPFLLAAGVVLALALGLYELGQYVAHKLPDVTSRTVRATTDPLLKALRTSVAAIEHVHLPNIRARLDALAGRITHALAVATGAIAHTIPRLGRLERSAIDYAKLHKWLKRALVGTLGAAVVARALAKLGLSWVRCSNVKRAGKQLCGMDARVLEGLLGEALLVASAISLVEFAEALQKPTALVADGLDRLIREL